MRESTPRLTGDESTDTYVSLIPRSFARDDVRSSIIIAFPSSGVASRMRSVISFLFVLCLGVECGCDPHVVYI